MYPCVKIDLDKLARNAAALRGLLARNGISMAAVTKVFCADPRIVEVLVGCGADILADSRLENIESYAHAGPRKMLLRLPSPAIAERVVGSCDISLNSEIATIAALAAAAEKAGKKHGVTLMVDLGDLREGVYHSNEELLLRTAEFVLSKKSLNFMGIGVNLTCYGSVLPTESNMQALLHIAGRLRARFGAGLDFVSGGNSSSLYLLENGKMPKGITNLRLGESIVRGVETAFGKPFAGLETDAIVLEAEVLEIMEKPSYPEGEIGINAFGEKIHYTDIGIRRRAIVGVGRQDVDHESLGCLMPGAAIVGASSDHLIVDVTDAGKCLAVGDVLSFTLTYGAVLSCFTSRYVGRQYL